MGPNGERIIVFIPARGGSKSIPLKNIKLLNNRPLIYYALDAATKCKYIDTVFVSTDSVEIKNCVLNYNNCKIQVVDRSIEVSTDTASTESTIIEFVEKNNNCFFDILILIQATSPLLDYKHLDEGIEKFFNDKCDSLLSVVRQKRFLWEEDNNGFIKPVNYNPYNRPRRQEFNGYLVENGAFYITYREQFINTKCRISGNISYYEMPDESYYELDEPSDWITVESILKKKNKINDYLIEKAKKIKLLAMDCDGVLTDGGMYYSKDGEELKKFNTRDGMGLSLLSKLGIKTVIITGENSEIVRKRANKLKIDDLFLDVKDKKEILIKLMDKYKLNIEEIAYVGDDINDIEILKHVGLSITTNNAENCIKKMADYITKRKGGDGAIREVCNLLIEAKEINDEVI